jgi:hypothetical protein
VTATLENPRFARPLSVFVIPEPAFNQGGRDITKVPYQQPYCATFRSRAVIRPMPEAFHLAEQPVIQHALDVLLYLLEGDPITPRY